MKNLNKELSTYCDHSNAGNICPRYDRETEGANCEFRGSSAEANADRNEYETKLAYAERLANVHKYNEAIEKVGYLKIKNFDDTRLLSFIVRCAAADYTGSARLSGLSYDDAVDAWKSLKAQGTLTAQMKKYHRARIEERIKEIKKQLLGNFSALAISALLIAILWPLIKSVFHLTLSMKDLPCLLVLFPLLFCFYSYIMIYSYIQEVKTVENSENPFDIKKLDYRE